MGGFLACQRFVTHVTGFATHFGVELAGGALIEALSMAMVPVFFLIGCMASALLIDRRKHLGKKPYYTTTFIFSGLTFLLITFLGQWGLLGSFGKSSEASTTFILLAALAFLSGVQNSMIGFASGLLVRTTHLTGITTDLGVGIIRMFYPLLKDDQRAYELKMNTLRLGTIVAFMFGSIIGGVFFLRWKYLGFLIPTSISLFLAFYSWQFHDQGYDREKKVSHSTKVTA